MFRGPGGAARYANPEDAQAARRMYLNAYKAVWSRTSRGRAYQRAVRKGGQSRPRYGDKSVADVYQLVATAVRLRCHYCGASLAINERVVDHYVPLALGGEHAGYNLVVACASCNAAKGASHPRDFLGIGVWSVRVQGGDWGC